MKQLDNRGKDIALAYGYRGQDFLHRVLNGLYKAKLMDRATYLYHRKQLIQVGISLTSGLMQDLVFREHAKNYGEVEIGHLGEVSLEEVLEMNEA